MSKSVDFREAAIAYHEAGHSLKETAETFQVSVSAISKWKKKKKETGNLNNKPLNRTFKKIDPEKLKAYVKEHPDATQQEMADEFGCCNQAISKALKRNKITRKKTTRYKEQDPEKVKEYKEKIKNIDPENMVYLDETGIDECLHREYGYAPRGEKVLDSVSGRKFQRTNIVAAKMGDKIIAPMQYNGTTDAPLFEYWFEQWLLPCLPENAVIIMDNASFHSKEHLNTIAQKHNRRIIFLPPYSPELNPIENFWHILKHWLKMNIHCFDSLDEAISAAFHRY